MRVAVVHIAAGKPDRLLALAEALARGFEAEGHRAELLDAGTDPSRLAGYDFVAIGTEAAGAGGTLPVRLTEFLKRSWGLQGKRCFAFVRKSSLRPTKLLERLMSAMEGEGMRVTYSEMLSSAAEATSAARNVPVERIQARG